MREELLTLKYKMDSYKLWQFNSLHSLSAFLYSGGGEHLKALK
jgi:hypothetical protein